MSEKKLSEKLLYAPKHGYDRLSEVERKEMNEYCEDYKLFLDRGKTERQCVEYCIELAEKQGFVEYVPNMALKAGDKVYCNNRGKGIMLAIIGSESLAKGANIAAAHTDAPRLDLKPRPLYEEAEMAYFKTHHYGGIRKYQWVTVPLELHGVVTLADGSTVELHVGGKPSDPQFIINDLLPHLGREQAKKPLGEAIPSESLNILVGSEPVTDEEEKSRFKLGVLQYLYDTYGIVEEDFISAELEAVPAYCARDVGFDRSFISAYGHDDRVCAYAELAALFALDKPARTAVCIFADKEEIGSEGVSGMQSEAFDKFLYLTSFFSRFCTPFFATFAKQQISVDGFLRDSVKVWLHRFPPNPSWKAVLQGRAQNFFKFSLAPYNTADGRIAKRGERKF